MPHRTLLRTPDPSRYLLERRSLFTLAAKAESLIFPENGGRDGRAVYETHRERRSGISEARQV